MSDFERKLLVELRVLNKHLQDLYELNFLVANVVLNLKQKKFEEKEKKMIYHKMQR